MGNNLVAPPTAAQEKAISLTKTASSIPSLIGAAYIIQHVMRSPRRRRQTATRIILGMSAMDLIYAMITFASTWPTPRGVRLYAVGNWTTCEITGFLYQGSRLASVLYNGSLTLYYLLTIRYGWKDFNFNNNYSRCKHMNVEFLMHAVPLLVGWSTAVACLPLKLYNPAFFGCTIAPFPVKCKMGKAPCERGKSFAHFETGFFFAPLWSVFVFSVIAMLMIYCEIKNKEAHNKTSFIQQQQPNNVNIIKQHGRGRCHSHSNGKSDNDSHAQEVEHAGQDTTIPDTERGNKNCDHLNSNTRRDSLMKILAIMTLSTRTNSNSDLDNNLDFSISFSSRNNRSKLWRQGQFSNKQESQQQLMMEDSERQCQRTQKKRRLTRQFAAQALLYCMAFVFTWCFQTVQVLLIEYHKPTIYIPVVFIIVVLGSLQGFWNATIYIRPRYLRYRRQQQEAQVLHKQQEARDQNLSVDQLSTPHLHALMQAISVLDEDNDDHSISDCKDSVVDNDSE